MLPEVLAQDAKRHAAIHASGGAAATVRFAACCHWNM